LIRGVGRGVGLLAWVVALAPMAALLPAALLDRGPGGEIRPTAFPLALTALDPYVWECVANSLELAAAVTVVSGLLGVWFATGVVRTRFWGRRVLVGLGAGLVAVPPAFAALGSRWVMGQGGATDRGPNLSSWVGWGIWFWVEAGLAIPLVALAAASALAKVEPAWEDAARLAGTGRGRAWRSLIWPTIRPEVARALGLVFTLTLVEPGAPIVLGLRRTLGFQIVEAALDRNQLGRAAVLAIGATMFAGLVRTILRRWGGAATPETSSPPEARIENASLVRNIALVAALGTAVVAAWLPILGLIALALRPDSGSPRPAVDAFTALVADPLLLRTLIHSTVVGLLVLAIVLVLARALASFSTTRFAGLVGLADWPQAFPPLAFGIGALAMPSVLGMGADGLATIVGSRSLIVVALQSIVDALDPDRTPWVLFVIAVATVCSPITARSAVERLRGLRPVLVDAAVCLGATPRKARRTLTGRWLGVSTATAVLTFVLAATNLTPALVLCPTADVRTVGPAVLVLGEEPGGSLARAAALASVAIAANLVALGLKCGSRNRG